jgi:geranylgeranyl pyrophosphate synthase
MIDAEEVIRNIASTGANEYTIGYFNRLLDEAVSELDNLETDTQANLILRSLIEIIRKV